MTIQARPTPTLPSNRRLALRATQTHARGGIEDQRPWDPDALWRRLRAIGRVVLAVAVLAVGTVAAVAARRYVTTSPRFGLRDLRVTCDGSPCRHHSSDRIASIGEIALGQNVVELDLEEARVRLERDPWIERATIARHLPASLAIDIVEREAAALVALPSGVFVATPQGDLFKKLEQDDPGDLPVVTGIAAADAAGDRESTAQLVRRALELGGDIERVGLFGGRVEELHVDGDGGLTAVVGRTSRSATGEKRPVRVAFGHPPYKAKVRVGMRVEAELVRRGARPTVVFLDDEAHTERIVVRLVSALPGAKVVVDGKGAP